MKKVEVKLTELQRKALAKHGGGIDAKLYQITFGGKRLNAYWPEVAVGGGTENYGGYSNIKWENVWLVVLTKKRLNEIYLNYGVRPQKHLCYVARIFNGCKMYMVCGLNCNEYDTTYFHTKKEAAKFIRENFTGDAKRIRLYDLKRAGCGKPVA